MLVLAWLSGCSIAVYQPMAGLHGPVVVDPTAPNLRDVKVTVYCVQGEMLNREETRMLCRRVGRLFENQGAMVETTVSGLTEDALAGEQRDQPVSTELTMELRSRQLHQSRDAMGWAICYFTFTLAPCVTEESFATDVTIRDETGFLLAEESLQGRIVRKGGVGPYVGNWLLDWLWREEDEKLGNDSAQRELSADLYGQLSQLMVNARIQHQVLSERYGTRATGSSSAPSSTGNTSESNDLPGLEATFEVQGGVQGGVEGGVMGGVEGGIIGIIGTTGEDE